MDQRVEPADGLHLLRERNKGAKQRLDGFFWRRRALIAGYVGVPWFAGWDLAFNGQNGPVRDPTSPRSTLLAESAMVMQP